MTEEELKEKIADLIKQAILEWYGLMGVMDDISKTKTKDILTLIRESGLFMDMEMVKGLMFEVQAKKCDQCPKNRMVSVNETP